MPLNQSHPFIVGLSRQRGAISHQMTPRMHVGDKGNSFSMVNEIELHNLKGGIATDEMERMNFLCDPSALAIDEGFSAGLERQ